MFHVKHWMNSKNSEVELPEEGHSISRIPFTCLLYTSRAHETPEQLVCRLLLEKKNKGYLKKQNADILAFKRDENLKIPENIDYDQFSGLSNEVKSKFKEIRPKTLGQALRIDGITPAAVYILLSHVKRKSIKHIA